MHQRLPDHPVFAPYRDSILATLKPCVDITLTPCDTLTLWQSKLGGWPYLSKDTDYPQDVQGRPLYLLAQINFADVPPLPDFPRQGILQFFISPFGSRKHLWGLEDKYPDRQDYFRVRYYPEVCTDPAAVVEDFAFVSAPPVKPQPATWLQKLGSWFAKPGPHMPFDHPCAMRFTVGEQLTTLEESGLHFCGKGVPDANADNFLDVLGEDFTEAYSEATECEGHRLGGYAYHIQDNVRRMENSPYRDYVLLLQLDSDEANGIMWGDLGVCHFFIHPDDLRRRDFSKVLYNWECY